MLVNVTVQLGKDQTISNTPSEIAAEVLAACEGDPEIDYCTVNVIASPEPGSAGTPPAPTPPPAPEG